MLWNTKLLLTKNVKRLTAGSDGRIHTSKHHRVKISSVSIHSFSLFSYYSLGKTYNSYKTVQYYMHDDSEADFSAHHRTVCGR